MGLKTFLAIAAAGVLGFLGWQSLRTQTASASPALIAGTQQAALQPAKTNPVQELPQAPQALRDSVEPQPANDPVAAQLMAEGRVIFCDGSPAAFLPVQFIQNGDARGTHSSQQNTDETGLFSLSYQGTGKISSNDSDFVDLIIPSVGFHKNDELVLVVAPNRPLMGICVDPEGEPIEGVGMLCVLPEELYARTGVIFKGHTSYADFYGISGAEGEFEFAPLPHVAGTQIKFEHEAYEPQSIDLPEDSDARLVITMTPKSVDSKVLAGVILDPEGNPVVDAMISLGESLGRSDGEGLFEFRLDEVENPTRLMAIQPGFAPVSLMGIASDKSWGDKGWSWPDFVTLQFEGEPKHVRGVVLDAAGDPVQGAKVWITDPTRMGYRGDFPVFVERHLLEKQLLWVNVTTQADGSFDHGGLLDRPYMLRAGHPNTCEFTGPIQATPGTDITLRFKAGATTSIEGHVVDMAGNPVPNARVFVDQIAYTMTDRSGMSYLNQLDGERTQTDAEGYFEIKEVARQGCTLHVSGSEIVDTQRPLELEGSPEPLTLVVDVQCQLRIELKSLGLALDQVKLLNALGAELQLRRTVRGGTHVEYSAPLPDGVQTLKVPLSATTAVFYSAGKELLRLPLELRPDELNHLRP